MAGRAPTKTWQVILGLHGGYESNIDFQRPNGAGDSGLVGRASLAHTRRSQHGEFSLLLQGGGVLYQDLTDANHLDGLGRLGFRYRFTPKTSLSFDGGASYLNTDLSPTLRLAGVQLQSTQSLGYGGGMRLDLTPGERTTMGLSVRYDKVNFDDPELLDTESGQGAFVLARRLSSRSSLSLNYLFLRTNDLSKGFDSHEAGLGWSYIVVPHLTLSLIGGPGYLRDPFAADHGQTWYYFGTAGLVGEIRRSTLNLQLRRSSNPAYGLGGNRLSYGVSLSAGIPFGRKTSLSLSGVHTWSEDPTGVASNYITDDGMGTFTVLFLRRLGLTLGYGYRRQDPEIGRTLTSHRGTAGLVWTYNRP